MSLEISNSELHKIIYMTIVFGLAYLLAFVLYFGLTKKEKKSK